MPPSFCRFDIELQYRAWSGTQRFRKHADVVEREVPLAVLDAASIRPREARFKGKHFLRPAFRLSQFHHAFPEIYPEWRHSLLGEVGDEESKPINDSAVVLQLSRNRCPLLIRGKMRIFAFAITGLLCFVVGQVAIPWRMKKRDARPGNVAVRLGG